MKVKTSIFFILCIITLACQARGGDTSNEKSVVPGKYLNAINKADSITIILIDPWSEAEENWMDGYGEKLNSKTCTCKQLKEELSSLLSNPKSFAANDMVKNCAFMPDAVVVFHTKSGNVMVSYSFYCDVCRFADAEQYKDFDGELIRDGFLTFLSKAYPKDRYIRYLVKQRKSKL